MKTYTLQQLKQKNTQRYRYSEASLQRLIGVDSLLVDLLFTAANYIDLKIISGYRTPQQQHRLYVQGLSTKDGYIHKSKHQTGRAVDVLPLPKIQEPSMYSSTKENTYRWAYFTGFIQALGLAHGLNIRTGFKWRSSPMQTLSRELSSNTLYDPAHIEIKD